MKAILLQEGQISYWEKSNKDLCCIKWDGKIFPADKIVVTGNPVRKQIAGSKVSRTEALQFFGLDITKKTLFVVGGSLGAKSINDVIASHLYDVETLNIQLIWQTGKHNASAYIQKGKAFKNVWVSEFIKEMEMAYAAADIVVSRAGAMAVTELCVSEKGCCICSFPPCS